MHFLVLGVGSSSMGEAIAARLQKENNTEITIADKGLKRETETLKKLAKLPRHENAALKTFDKPWYKFGCGFDISKQNDLHLLFQNFDVVVNALPVVFSPTIVEAVIAANKTKPAYQTRKTHYCDLGGSTKIDKILMKFDKEAQKTGTSVIFNCGFKPGLGNAHEIDMLDCFSPDEPLESMINYVCGLPKEIGYKPLFNLKGLEEIYYNYAPVLSGGKIRRIKPRSHYESFSSERFGLYFGESSGRKMEAAVTAGTGMLPQLLKGRVLKLQEKTLRYEGHYERIKKIQREDFIGEFRKMLDETPLSPDDFCLMHIEAIGKCKIAEKKKKMKAVRTIYIESDEHLNSMQKATGFSTAIMALLIAEGRAKTGVRPPEDALSAKEIIALTKNDVPVIQNYLTYLV